MPHHCSHRSIRWLAMLFALSAIAASCGGGSDSDGSGTDDTAAVETPTTAGGDDAATTEPPADAAGEPVKGGELKVGIVAESNSWYPPEAEWSFSAGVLPAASFYETLFVMDGEGKILPFLAAERATPNDDATEWTVKLRPGITFHDGTTMDAQAFVDMSLLWEAGRFATPGEGIEKTTAVDDLTLTYSLFEADPSFETTMTGSRGVAFSPEAAKAAGENAAENPVGTGPFVFESWTRDSELVATANPNYWQEGQPNLDQITFRVLTDNNSRIASFESGELDVITQGGVDGMAGLIDKGFTPLEYFGNGAGIVVFNALKPPFDDARVRRAVTYGISGDDINSIAPGTLSGEFQPRSQYFSTASQWFSEEADDAYAHNDPDQAKVLMEEYVNDSARSDGKAAGEPISFEYGCTTSPVERLVSQLLVQGWADIGFDVTLREEEQATMVTRVVGDPSTVPAFQGDFDATCWADGTNEDPLALFDSRYGEVGTNVPNWSNYTNPAVDEQIEILRSSTDEAERKAAAGEISRITAEDAVIAWRGTGSTVVMIADKVKNAENFTWPDGTPGSRMSAGRLWWNELWVE